MNPLAGTTWVLTLPDEEKTQLTFSFEAGGTFKIGNTIYNWGSTSDGVNWEAQAPTGIAPYLNQIYTGQVDINAGTGSGYYIFSYGSPQTLLPFTMVKQ